MTEQNPVSPPILTYAGPARDPQVPNVYTTRNGLLLIRHGAELPTRCIKCASEVAIQLVKVRVSAVPKSVADNYRGSGTVGMGVIGPILFVGRMIESLFKARRIVLQIPLCNQHRGDLFWIRVAWWAPLACAAALVGLGIAFREPGGILGGILFSVPVLIFWRYPAPVRAILIDDNKAIVSGADPDFLRTLPRGSG